MARSNTTWVRGQTGNAGGRPKAALNVQELARSYTTQAIETLAASLSDPKLKVQAASVLLDRGWGRPLQALAGEPAQPLRIDFRWADATTNTLPDAAEALPTIEADADDSVDGTVVTWAVAQAAD